MSASVEMPRYRCHKQVWALKIAGISFPQNEAGDAELAFAEERYAPKLMPRAWLDRHNPEVGGYLVVYDDGYQSFSPAKAFEEGYTRISNVARNETGNGIGWAVKAMHNGHRVRRAGWNGKGMFLFLVPGSSFQVNRPPLLGIYPEGHTVDYHAHVDMKTAQGYVVPWLCSQADLLATDWEIAD